MSLKKELQDLRIPQVLQASKAYSEKFDALRRNDEAEFNNEMLASAVNFEALNALVTFTVGILMDDGLTEDEALFAATGASFVVGVLSELAETQDMPPID